MQRCDSILDGAEFDPYRVLGILPDADDVVVSAAHKALMRKYHPDTSRDPRANALAQAINAAFDLLSDPMRRAALDRTRAARARTAPRAHAHHHVRAPARPMSRGTAKPQSGAMIADLLSASAILLGSLLLMQNINSGHLAFMAEPVIVPAAPSDGADQVASLPSRYRTPIAHRHHARRHLVAAERSLPAEPPTS